MKRPVIAAITVAASLALAACTGGNSQSAAPPAAQRHAETETPLQTAALIDGKMSSLDFNRDHVNFADECNGCSDTFDNLAVNAQATQPVVTNFEDLDTVTKALPTLGQRAIAVTKRMIDGGSPVNLLSGKLFSAFSPKDAPEGSDQIQEDRGRLSYDDFGALYLERKGGVVQAAVVSLETTTAAAPATPRYTSWHGLAQLQEKQDSTLPDQMSTSRFWGAREIQPDCTQERSSGGPASTKCLYASSHDKSRYYGSQPLVIMVSRVHVIEWTQQYGNGQQLSFLSYVTLFGNRFATALRNDSFPYSAFPPLTGTVTENLRSYVTSGGKVYGAEDLGKLPAIQLPIVN